MFQCSALTWSESTNTARFIVWLSAGSTPWLYSLEEFALVTGADNTNMQNMQVALLDCLTGRIYIVLFMTGLDCLLYTVFQNLIYWLIYSAMRDLECQFILWQALLVIKKVKVGHSQKYKSSEWLQNVLSSGSMQQCWVTPQILSFLVLTQRH